MASNDPCVLLCHLCVCGARMCTEAIRSRQGYAPVRQEDDRVLDYAFKASLEKVPPEILHLSNESSHLRLDFITLYAFADVFGRMPRQREEFSGKALGKWLFEVIYVRHRADMLTPEQLLALSKVPHYPIPVYFDQSQTPMTEQSYLDAVRRATPVEISSLDSARSANGTFALLYVFAVVHGRMPQPGEMYCDKALGNWVQDLYGWHSSNKLAQDQLMALSRIPHYPIPFDFGPPTITEQPMLPSAPVEEDYYDSDDQMQLITSGM